MHAKSGEDQAQKKGPLNKIIIRECITLEEIQSTYAIMRQLRPHVTSQEYFQRVFTLMKEERFRLLGAYTETNQCVGIVGFQELNRLSLGKIIYVADLVTDEPYRSRGVGSQLLFRVKEEATKQNIDAIVLDSAIQRKRAHEFYHRHGYKAESYSFRLFKPFTADNNPPKNESKKSEIIAFPSSKL